MIPFLNIAELTDSELETRIGELTKRISIAQKTNSKAKPQLTVMIQSLIGERSTRVVKKQIEDNPKFQPGLVMTTDEDNQPDKDEDDNLVNIK